jgi:glycosyltransferase involved in cell wall biosynthesis
VKIAFVTETFPPEINGVAMTFGVIARELGRRRHEVTVYRPWRSDLSDSGPRPDFLEVPMPGLPIPGYPQLRLGLPAGGRLARHWRADRPDLVHVATEGPLGASAVGAARRLGIPVTSSFHTNFHSYARLYGWAPLRGAAVAWLRRVHNRTLRTFAPTQELCAELASMGFNHLALLSRGVDTRQFGPERRNFALRASWRAGPEDPVFLHVGRLAVEKNYGLLFRAFAAARAACPASRFVVVGDGPLRAGLERGNPGVVFTGFIPRDELARHCASADVYIHASLTETFGNVLTEAMASGLAVAGFDYAAARQFVRNGENGISVPVGRPDELVAAAARLASDGELRRRLRRAARTTLEAQSWETVIARFEADLAGIVAGHGSVRAPGTALPSPHVAA